MAFSPKTAFDYLRTAHEQGLLAHAYLLTGPLGSGKSQLAQELAALVNATPVAGALKHPDVHVLSPESKSRRIVTDQIRELEHELQMKPSQGRKKVAIILEADRLVLNAANAFLKTLEEPPANSLLLLLTDQAASLPETILSRCLQVSLLPPPKTRPTGRERELLDLLRIFFQSSETSLAKVFGLVRDFQQLLAAIRAGIQKEHDDEQKREESLYRQTTDAGAWLEAREDYFKARTESRYVQERARLSEVLVRWWADVLCHQHGYRELGLPDFAGDTARLSAEYPVPEVLRRVSLLEDLREHFNRNVQEALAIEVVFVKAFAGIGMRPG